MTEVLADFLSTAVGLVLTAVMVSAILNIYSSSMQVNARVSEQQAMATELKEYREYNQYDYKHVYQQDIVSVIFKSRGLPAVHVRSANGTYSWKAENAPCSYTTANISELIDPTVIYDSSIKRGINGELIGYEFIAHVDGCGR